jgi:hypothetical protein
MSISSLNIDLVLQKIKNNDPNILYIRNVPDCKLYVDHDLSENINAYQYKNLLNQTIKSVIFKHEIIIVDGWEKNAVYYNLDKYHFPNAKIIIMNSHPCEYSTLTRSPNWQWIALYNHLWFNDFDNIFTINLPTSGGLNNIEVYKNILEAILQLDKKYTADYDGKLTEISSNIFKNL